MRKNPSDALTVCLGMCIKGKKTKINVKVRLRAHTIVVHGLGAYLCVFDP